MNPMPDKKSGWILADEERFALTLAGKVLDKPKIDIWMFLLPVLFIYYMNDFKKFKEGREVFAAQYLISRKRALAEAFSLVHSGQPVDPRALAEESGMSAEVQNSLAELYVVLIGHYEALLKAVGEDFNSLVRSAYQNLTNYLLFINQLHLAEKKLNLALQPQLFAATAGAPDILSAIERHSRQIHRHQASEIFS